ncbi:hypothetical protein PFICI_01630 [Pestalotiopsis fici W106-1]|uniref:SprT-like domain-containing protein n=1 Tax=Pestalotiopsis fici (strain W106-1 / CGMCC3.15140) TaxID=1229662 RepID=W3XQL0_PESFW|nr:uncharacterized protein PFICI_01630 [Pestalotiopsis fici W106-1]ETS87802.1 hypothetical protein PFICI_01630 [Pestalotiopsis fici W106-1]
MVAKATRYAAAGPSSIKHKALNTAVKYAPFGDHDDVANTLRKGCWRARDVLNFTVQAFYKRNEDDRLSDTQEAARTQFIKDYRTQWVQFDGRELRDDPVEPTYNDILDLYRQHLDKYYFFSTLSDYRLAVHACNTNSGDDCLPIESWQERRLIIPTSNRKTVFDLHEVLAVLLHEMTHLYLQLTVCKCSDCNEGMLLGVGAADDQHGPIFQMLHRLILSDLRSWHDQLAKFDDDDCPEKSVSQYSLECHDAACEGSTKSWKYRYNNKAHKKHWISLVEESDVVSVRVRKVLRDSHKALEAKLLKADEKKDKSAKREDSAQGSNKYKDSDVESDVASDDYRYGGDSSTSGNKGKGKAKPESSKTTKGRKKRVVWKKQLEEYEEDTSASSNDEGEGSADDDDKGGSSKSSSNTN